jgi:hypothetical protein
MSSEAIAANHKYVPRIERATREFEFWYFNDANCSRNRITATPIRSLLRGDRSIDEKFLDLGMIAR